MCSSERMYEIIAGSFEKDPQWILAVSGFSTALGLMNRIASEYPGPYFIFDTDGRRVVAQIDARTSFAA
jgi:hypothetical protein